MIVGHLSYGMYLQQMSRKVLLTHEGTLLLTDRFGTTCTNLYASKV
jgi:hypothetical protein